LIPAILALGALTLAGAATEPGSRAPGAAPAAPRTCAPGPASLPDLSVQPEGFPRFDWPAGTDFHEFYFVRAMYSGGRGSDFGFRRGRGAHLGDGGPAWSTDYPRADRHMVLVTQRLSNIDACAWEHPVSLADPELRRFPFIYALEWGEARLTDAEISGLRDFLEAGGLLMIDDFWGSYEWANFQREMHRVLPGRSIVDIPRDHLLFHIHYTIEGEILQVPNVANGRAVALGYPGAVTSEGDGYVPHVMGILDDAGRLMVVINWNTDLGDALEWAESPFYPLRYSTFASELFLNTIMYSMSG
jgi:hypothetical protein